MDLQPYSQDCFSKILRTLFDFLNKTYWVSLFQRNNTLIFLTGVSCFSVTLFHSTLLASTDRQNDRRSVKYTRYAWAGGTFFTVVLLCQFSVLAGNRFWFYILLMYLEYHTVVVLCQFLLIWQEIVFGTYVLSVQYSCAVVSLWPEKIMTKKRYSRLAGYVFRTTRKNMTRKKKKVQSSDRRLK